MQYSISDLEQLSGVHAHTIRMWEQRYGALHPHRSAGNTRYYDDKQLVRLLNIVSINQSGKKISEICTLSDSDIRQFFDREIDATKKTGNQFEFYVAQLISYGIAYNEVGFDGLLSKCITQYGFSETYIKVVYPLLERLGLMWRKDSICAAQEHFLVNIIRQKMLVATNNLPFAKQAELKWILFLPEQDEHEIGLLFANYLLRKAGKSVIYLGAKVPLTSLKDAIENNNTAHLLLFMVKNRSIDQIKPYLKQLSELGKEQQIYLCGHLKLVEELVLPKNISLVKGIADFQNLLSFSV